jgi:hypothetical protein
LLIFNQQFFLLAFAGRKLFTQLVHNYFPDEKGPAAASEMVRVSDCRRLLQGDQTASAWHRPCERDFWQEWSMTLKEAMIWHANGRGICREAVEAVVA